MCWKEFQFGSLHVTETLFRIAVKNEDEGKWKRETKMRCLKCKDVVSRDPRLRKKNSLVYAPPLPLPTLSDSLLFPYSPQSSVKPTSDEPLVRFYSRSPLFYHDTDGLRYDNSRLQVRQVKSTTDNKLTTNRD